MQFGAHIKALREARGMSVREFAKTVGKSPTFVSRVETQQEDYIKEETVEKWAKVLNEDPDYLLALAGKIRSDIVAIITRNPKVFIEMLRAMRGMPKQKQAEIARKVVDGDW